MPTLGTLRRHLSLVKNRREALAARLPGAEQELLAARIMRQHLMAEEISTLRPRDEVTRFQDRYDDLNFHIGECDREISAIEGDITRILDGRRRDGFVQKQRRRRGTDRAQARPSTSRPRRLSLRLEATEKKLAEAIGERRMRTAVDDSGVAIQTGADKVFALTGVADDLRVLANEADAKIRQLELDLTSAREREQREQAIAELSPALDALVTAVEQLRIAGVSVVGALPGVVSRVPFSNPNFAADLSGLLTNIGITINETVTRARQQVEQLKSGGETRIIAVPEPVPTVPAPTIGERLDCLLVCDSCWREGDVVVTAPRGSIRPLPADVATRAIELGWAHARTSPMVEQLIAGEQVNPSGAPWHVVAVADCIDLMTAPKRAPEGAADLDPTSKLPGLPPGAVERTGPAVVGTATAVAP